MFIARKNDHRMVLLLSLLFALGAYRPAMAELIPPGSGCMFSIVDESKGATITVSFATTTQGGASIVETRTFQGGKVLVATNGQSGSRGSVPKYCRDFIQENLSPDAVRAILAAP